MTKHRFNLKNVAIIVACFAVCMTLAITGCKKDKKDDNGGGNVALTGIKFEKSTVTVKVGESATLIVVPVPSDAKLPKCDFASEDEDIATVDGNGKVSAIAEGETTITVTTSDGKFNAECTVKVTKTGGGGEEEIFKEPCLNFGASLETIKTCETREIKDEYYFILKYKGENAEVEEVEYYFEDDKMSIVSVKLFNKNNIGKRLVTFLSSKYRFLIKLDEETYMFETTDGKIWINLVYFSHTDNWDVSYMESVEKGYNDNLSRFKNSNK